MTESNILEKLRAHSSVRQTCILIAHNLSTVAHADQILVLKQGLVNPFSLVRQLAHCSNMCISVQPLAAQLDALLLPQIVEQGTHSELLEKQGEYHAMWNVQRAPSES